MKLADIKGDKAFEVLADLIDPITALSSDKEFNEARKNSIKDAVQVALRKHPKELTEILAILDLEDPETYEVNMLTLPRKALELINDPEVLALFPSQGPWTESTSTGSASENTVENGK